jgi:hypothetical protein
MLRSTTLSSRSATIEIEVTLLFLQDPGNGLHDTKQGGLSSFISLYHNLLCHFLCLERLVSHSSLNPRDSFLVSTLFAGAFSFPLCPQRLPSSHLSVGLHVAQIPSQRSSLEALRMSAYTPHPSLTLEEVFPPTNLTVIHLWVRGRFWS